MLYISLLNNITLLISLSIIHSLLLRFLDQDSKQFQILAGLLFGSVAVIGMLNSIELLPGIIFDGRSIVIVSAGVFGGPVAGVIAMFAGAIFRSYVGGDGTLMGILVITEAGLLGIVFFYLRRSYTWATKVLSYYLLGLIVHILMIILSYTLPGGVYREILPQIAIPVLLIFPVATLFLFLLFQSQENYMKLMRDLSVSEAALKESNKIARIGRWEYDLRNNKLEWSDTVFDIFEIERGDFKVTYESFLDPIHPDDRDAVDKAYKNSLITKTPYEIEHRLLMKDGRIKWVNEKCETSFDKSGQAVSSTGIVQDVTEKRMIREALEESRQMLRFIIDTIPVRVFWKDREGRYLGCNIPFAKDAGYDKPEEIIGMDDYQLGWSDQADLFRKVDREVIASGKPRLSFEEAHTSTEGKEVWLHSNILPLTGIADNIIGILGTYEDITSRKQMENDLIIARDKARESDQLKTAFLNNLSHEIRTPLNAIVGFSELLNRDGLSENELRHYTGIIKHSSSQLLAIIDDIFDIAAIEAGQVRTFMREINVKKLLSIINDQFKLKAAENNNELIYLDSLSDDQSKVVTDETKLSQILNNLLVNGIKFTKNGKITLSCIKKEEELLFCIKDTGVGIPEEFQEKIFEKFRQGNFESTGEFGGSGIGLYIARSYIRLLGGRIWLESEPGSGSEFFFTIPFISAGKQKPVTKIIHIQIPRHRTILIAEDNSVNFLLLEEYLSVYDLTLIHVWNGKEALEKCLERNDIDLVLMDVKMPVMDGLEATRLIKEKKPQLPVIALTAYAQAGDREKTAESGCDDYLSKPFEINLLLKMLSKYLNQALILPDFQPLDS